MSIHFLTNTIFAALIFCSIRMRGEHLVGEKLQWKAVRPISR